MSGAKRTGGNSLVAVEDGIVIGFGDIDQLGCLDCLYVHASVTARPFFKKRGYQVIKEQRVERQGIVLNNYNIDLNYFY